MRDCTTIAARGRESKKVAPNVPKENSHFYALQAGGSKLDDDDVGK